jgi:hypothetical protein
MYGSCNNCGEVAKIITIEETEDHYGLCSIRGPYHSGSSTVEVEVTECCEHFDWTECDEPFDLDE